MTSQNKTPDALQFEALLVARMYIYEMFHHLCGGCPNAELLDVLSADVVQGIFEEYESVENVDVLRKVLAAYRNMDVQKATSFISDASDEYTRVFIGPASLPASPYESPYRGSHDTALLQENTLKVRRAYADFGLVPKRIHAVPDDHIAFMCSFMSKRAKRAVEFFEADDIDKLITEFASQVGFMSAHMLGWLDIFANSVATSAAASSDVLYPKTLKALAGFVSADFVFLAEGVEWLETDFASKDDEGSADDAYLPNALDHDKQAIAQAKKAYSKLLEVKQRGLDDYLLVQIND